MDVDMATPTNGADGDLFEDLITAEERFYKEGYQQGYEHGRLHGLFEGRELGREKGWEVWEEVGFYEGWAGMYVSVLERKGVVVGGRGKEPRALNHAKILLDLITRFPISNPSETLTITIPNPTPDPENPDESPTSNTPPSVATTAPANEGSTEVDLPALLSSIRARYRLLYSSLNVRPRLTTAANKDGQVADDSEGVDGGSSAFGGGGAGGGVVEGIEGPMKGVDTRQLRF